MKDRAEVHTVSVQLPQEWANSTPLSSAMFKVNGSSRKNSSFVAPTDISGFQCYGLNVRGPGIQSDPRLGCTDPASGMGLIAGFYPITQGSIEVVVPAGPDRVVELIGIQSSVGCPLLNDLLNSGGKAALDNFGDPYLLGSTTTNIFDDTAVTIYASFDSNTPKAFQGCGDGGGNGNGGNNGQPTLMIGTMNNISNIQKGDCMPIQVQARNNVNNLAMPTFNISVTGGTLYSNTSCNQNGNNCCTSGTEVVNTQNFPTNQNWVQYYLVPSTILGGSVAVSLSESTGVWQTSAPTYTVVQKRLNIASIGMNGQTSPNGSCVELDLKTQSVSTGTFTSLEVNSVYQLSINKSYNGNMPANPATPSVHLYKAAGCTSGEIIASSTMNGSLNYNLTTSNVYYNINASASSVYILDNTPEVINLGFTIPQTTDSLPSDEAEPAGNSLSFVPFNIPSAPTGLSGSMAGGASLMISFTSTTAIDSITIGTNLCTSATKTSASVTCTIPPSTSAGRFPISIVVGGVSYQSGYNYTYNAAEMVGAASVPTKLSIITVAQTVASNTCSGINTVQTQDSLGSVATVTTPLMVNLSNANLTFFSDSGCLNSITSANIGSGASSVSFYFKATSSGSPVITVSGGGLNQTTQTESIIAAQVYTPVILVGSATNYSPAGGSVQGVAHSGATTLVKVCYVDSNHNVATSLNGTGIFSTDLNTTAFSIVNHGGCGGGTGACDTFASGCAPGVTVIFSEAIGASINIIVKGQNASYSDLNATLVVSQ